EKVRFVATGKDYDADEIGILQLSQIPKQELSAGNVGYIITGIKESKEIKVGDTITTVANPCAEGIKGFEDVKPMVFAGIYPIENDDFEDLRDSLEKLQLNDASLVYEPESSVALGFGFRCGYLGLLHLEIVRDRLEREFDIELISTAPNVVYEVEMEDGKVVTVTNPSEFPAGKIGQVREPIVEATILVRSEFIGTVMELCQERRGIMGNMNYLSETRVEMHYTLPLAEVVFDFFDQLKSRTRGYGSLDYEPAGEQTEDLAKVDT